MIKDLRYIIKKVIIGVLIALCLFYIKGSVVHAKIFNPSLYVSGNYLKPGNFAGVNGNYANLRLNWAGWVDDVPGPTDPIYVSVVLCRSWAADGIDVTDSNGNISSDTTIASMAVQNTQVKCAFNNSPYNLMGNVSIITFKKSGAGQYNNTYFKIYTAINVQGTYYTDIQLLDITFNIHEYANINDYSNISTSKQLDDINNSINSSANSIITNVVGAINNSSQFIQTLIGRVQNLEDTMKDDSIDESFQGQKINDIQGSGYSNGSISDIVLLPVTLINKVVDGLSSNSCSSFNLGSFYGTNIVLPCYTSSDVSGWLGSSVYTIVDLLMSFGVILGIRKLVLKIYNTIVFLKEGGNTID